jgi:hypothetical protein
MNAVYPGFEVHGNFSLSPAKVGNVENQEAPHFEAILENNPLLFLHLLKMAEFGYLHIAIRCSFYSFYSMCGVENVMVELMQLRVLCHI